MEVWQSIICLNELYSSRGERERVHVDRIVDVIHKVTLVLWFISEVYELQCGLDLLPNYDNLVMGNLSSRM